MRLTVVLLILLLCQTLSLPAQRSHGGRPLGVSAFKSNQSVDWLQLPTINNDSLKASRHQYKGKKSFKSNEYGINRTVSIKPATEGTWDTLPCGSMIWYMGIHSPGAKSLSLYFDHYALQKGQSLFLYDPAQKTVLGAFTQANNNPQNILRTAEIPGDRLIIELQCVKGNTEKSVLSLGAVGHAYRDLFKETGDTKASGSCNVDINCSAGLMWQNEKRAVVKYTYSSNGSNYHCSGALMNNTFNNGSPLLITARHCIDTDSRAGTTVFYFNYESEHCDGPLYNTSQTLGGSDLLSSVSGLDYSLLRLHDIIPLSYSPYFSGYNAIDVAPTSSVCIHHPRGDAKKISVDEDPAVSATARIDNIQFNAFAHWKILEWELGTTEGGSSGSPLFDQDHYIVGTLSGGDANCTSPVNDYFSKIASAWNTGTNPSSRLKDWLDPTGLNIMKHEGWDPMQTPCDTLNKHADSLHFSDINLSPPESGSISGHNSLRHTQYAEYFPLDNPLSISGINLYMGNIHSTSPFDIITIKMWQSEDSLPGQVLFEKEVLLDELNALSNNTIDFDQFIPISSNIFIGYEISYTQSDSLHVLLITHSDDSLNTAFLYDAETDSSWHAYTDYYGLSASLASALITCYWTPDVSVESPEGTTEKAGCTVSTYPNPTSHDLFLEVNLPPNEIKQAHADLYTLMGQFIRRIPAKQLRAPIAIQNLPEGIYIIQLNHQGGTCSERFIIQR